MPVPTLTNSRCSVSRQWRPVLAQGHDVHVVVDEHRRVVALGEPLGDREAVPAGHDRRVDRRADGERRPGRGRRRRSRARRPAVRPRAREQLEERARGRASSTASGPSAMSISSGASASGVGREVADRQARVRGAEVGGEHDAGGVVEGQHGRRAAAGRRAVAGLVDELVGEQRVDALGDGRAGEAGAARELGPRDGLAVADQPQHGARRRSHGLVADCIALAA